MKWTCAFYTELSRQLLCIQLPCLILSENAGSGIAFFKKFSMDLSNAALCGKHCAPVQTIKSSSYSGADYKEQRTKLPEQDSNLWPPDYCALHYPLSFLALMLAVSLFCLYLCSGVPVRSHSTCNSRVARVTPKFTIQPGKQQPGDHLEGYGSYSYYGFW